MALIILDGRRPLLIPEPPLRKLEDWQRDINRELDGASGALNRALPAWRDLSERVRGIGTHTARLLACLDQIAARRHG